MLECIYLVLPTRANACVVLRARRSDILFQARTTPGFVAQGIANFNPGGVPESCPAVAAGPLAGYAAKPSPELTRILLG